MAHSTRSTRITLGAWGAGGTLHPVAQRLLAVSDELLGGLPDLGTGTPLASGAPARDLAPDDVPVLQAVLDAVDRKPAKFERERLGVVEPFDTATPRQLLGGYQTTLQLRDKLRQVLAALDGQAVAVAAQLRALTAGAYEQARIVAAYDNGVASALSPALELRQRAVAARRRKEAPTRLVVSNTLKAGAAKAKAEKAEARRAESVARAARKSPLVN